MVCIFFVKMKRSRCVFQRTLWLVEYGSNSKLHVYLCSHSYMFLNETLLFSLYELAIGVIL